MMRLELLRNIMQTAFRRIKNCSLISNKLKISHILVRDCTISIFFSYLVIFNLVSYMDTRGSGRGGKKAEFWQGPCREARAKFEKFQKKLRNVNILVHRERNPLGIRFPN